MNPFSLFVPGMVIVMLTCGVQVATAQSDSSPMHHIGAGSQFVVGAAPVVIPANEEFVYFQDGALSSSTDVDNSRPSCRLQVSTSGAERPLLTGRKLIVTGAWFRNSADNSTDYDILLFEHDKAVDQLQCNKGKGTKDNITIGEVKAALGELFKLVPPAPAKSGKSGWLRKL